MKKNIHIAFVISSLFLILFSYNNCEGGKKSNINSDTPVEGGDNPLNPGDDDDDDDDDDDEDEGSKVGDKDIDTPELEGEVTSYESGPSEVESSFFNVMTAEGILNSFSSVTGVPFLYEDDSDGVPKLIENISFFSKWGTGPMVNSYYNNIKGNLPKDPTLDKFNSSSLNSIVSLASSFCEEVFIGTHPLTGVEYKSALPSLDLDTEEPEESDVISFVDKLLTWLVPHVSVDERAKEVMRGSVQDRLESFSNFKNSGIEKHVFHTNYNNEEFVITASESPTVTDDITFEDSFFLSYFAMPEDTSNGFVNPNDSNSLQKVRISNSLGYFEIQHSFDQHSFSAVIHMYDFWQDRNRTAKFIINDPAKNRLKMKPYNIVIEYVADPTIDNNKVSVQNDFNVYINGEKVYLASINNYHWTDYYSGIDKRFDKSFSFFGTSREEDGVFIPRGAKISIQNDSRLSFGNIEIFKGTYEDVVKNATEEKSEFLYDEDGDFTFARSIDDVSSRGANMFFGRVATENENERVLYFSTSVGTFQRSKVVDTSGQSIINDGFDVKRKINQSWVIMTPEQLESSFSFNEYDPEIIFPKPFLSIAPLMCTAVISSGYFIFN